MENRKYKHERNFPVINDRNFETGRITLQKAVVGGRTREARLHFPATRR
jgi:hypothetical protein